MEFIVGTFNTPELYLLRFNPPTVTSSASLTLVRKQAAIGNHSWLALSHKSDQRSCLYATAWTEPPSVAAYSIDNARTIKLINSKPVKARSGYVCASPTHVYSVGGPSGEAFSLRPDGGIGDLVQELSFVSGTETTAAAVPHGDFGGLRHGSHSVDLSPDGKSLYVADIGRNAIFTYNINDQTSVSHLQLGEKHISPRSNDGPRHTWPHPNGKVLYSLQEHSSMVDLFDIASDGVTLKHIAGVKIIPEDRDPKDYWADEVRISIVHDRHGEHPQYLYASTRGLHKETKGYVAVFELQANGTLAREEPLHIWETPTSGGIANAIEPSPTRGDGVEYLAMTDSEEGFVFVLQFDGQAVSEVARLQLGHTSRGDVVQAATAVWL